MSAHGKGERIDTARPGVASCSLQALLQEGVGCLSHAGIPNAAQEALWLLEAATGLSRLLVYTDPDVVINDARRTVTAEYFSRRAAGEPLQYILGTQEFYGLEFTVPHGVFIPRPETELIVEEVLRYSFETSSVPLVMDVCTGSGCLAVALAITNPRLLIYAIDQSPLALNATCTNAVRHKVDNRIRCIRGNFLAPFSAGANAGTISVIVSNPPYIPRAALETLPKDVREYEPHVALDGGPDGFDAYRVLIKESWLLLKPGGLLVLEMGAGQAETLCLEAERMGGYAVHHIQPDAAGIDRVVSLERTP